VAGGLFGALRAEVGLGFAAVKTPPAVKKPAVAVKTPPAVKQPPAAAVKTPPAVKKPASAMKAPPAVKRPLRAYALFMKEVSKMETKVEGQARGERTTMITAKWKVLGVKEKKKFEDEAAMSRKAYEDAQPPKKALNSWMLFSNDKRAGVMKANPDFGISDIGKKLGEMWTAASAADKKAYAKKWDDAKKVREKAMVEYIKEHGEPPKKVGKTKKAKVA